MVIAYFHNNMIINKLFIPYVGCNSLVVEALGKKKLKFLQIMQLIVV